MKMNMFQRGLVHLALCVPDQFIYSPGVCFYLLRQIQVSDPVQDLLITVVLMASVVVVTLVMVVVTLVMMVVALVMMVAALMVVLVILMVVLMPLMMVFMGIFIFFFSKNFYLHTGPGYMI